MIQAASILLSLAGWSAGTASWSTRRLPVPSAFDLFGIPALWSVLLIFLPDLAPGHLPAVSASVLSGFLAGSLSALLFGRRYPSVRREPSAPVPAGRAGEAWIAWKRFARRMGGFQGRVILGFFYFTVFAPFGVILRLTADPLRKRDYGTGWVQRPKTCGSSDECLRQY